MLNNCTIEYLSSQTKRETGKVIVLDYSERKNKKPLSGVWVFGAAVKLLLKTAASHI